jgi:tripartite-type tricarboxylate transporter receptor subunit TctC
MVGTHQTAVRRIAGKALTIVGMALIGLATASADEVEDFYKGRAITLVVSSGVGGGYDTYSRVLARHVNRHIPGQPRMIVQNMPGAGSLTAANYMYNVAAKDGTVISTTDSTMPFYNLWEGSNSKFDPLRMNWLGSIANQLSICIAWHTSPIKTLDDALERPMRLASTGGTTLRVTLPRLYNHLAGSKFEMVLGYSSAEVFLAMERGEVDGTCMTYDTLLAAKYEWLESKKVTVLAQFGKTPAPGLEAVPLGLDRITNAQDRAALELILSQQITGRPVTAPPGVPADRLQALRTAFDATMRDPQFLAEADKAHLWVDPLTAVQMNAIITQGYNSSAELVDYAKALLKRAAK